MNRLALLSATLLVLGACGSSVAGTAAGHCRIRYGYHGEAGPPIEDQERTDQVTMTITDAGGDTVRIRGAGCDLVASKTPGANGPEYAITSGSCHMDVPGAGQRTFPVRFVAADRTHTDSPGDIEAYMNVQGNEVALVFVAALAPGEVRCDCDLVKH